MASIEYISKLLNVSGVQMPTGGAGSEPTDKMLPYGALGLGKLADGPLTVGLAIYVPCQKHEAEACNIIHRLVETYVALYQWDCRRPVRRKHRSAEVEERVHQFKQRLASLTLFELKQDGKCMACFGTGTKPGTYQTCRKCKGDRNRPMAEFIKYDWLQISKYAWRTWKYRYNRIFMVVSQWKAEFDDHIVNRLE